MASHSENIHTICGKKEKKSTAFGDVILMGFEASKSKEKKHDCINKIVTYKIWSV